MASKYDTTNIKTFDNEVLSTVLENQLITALDLNNYITVDYSMTEKPGMKKVIRTYSGTGDVEDLAMGSGNTGDIGSKFEDVEYEVTTTQGRVPYYDEQDMNDPVAVDAAIKHLSTQLTNDITTKIVAELAKATNTVSGSADFDTIVDAVSALPKETNEGLYCLISRKDLGKFQKNLKNQLQYVEAFARTGYIGSIAGVPIAWTDAVPAGTAYVATREAVTCFYKKGAEVETERDANTRQTTLYGRNVKVIALTNKDKVVKITLSTGTQTTPSTPSTP